MLISSITRFPLLLVALAHASPTFDAAGYYTISPADQPNQCVTALDWHTVPPEKYPIRILPCISAGAGASWGITAGAQGRVKLSSKLYPTRDLDYVQPDGYPNVAILGPASTLYHNQDFAIKGTSSEYHVINAWLDNTGLCTKQVDDVLAVILDSCNAAWVMAPVSDSTGQITQSGSTSSQQEPTSPPPPPRATSTSPPPPPATSAATTTDAAPTSSTTVAGATIPTTSRSSSSRSDGGSTATTFETRTISTSAVEPPSAPSITPQATLTNDSHTAANKRKIEGGIAGGVGGLVFAGLVVYYCYRRKRRASKPLGDALPLVVAQADCDGDSSDYSHVSDWDKKGFGLAF